jgi:AAA domain
VSASYNEPPPDPAGADIEPPTDLDVVLRELRRPSDKAGDNGWGSVPQTTNQDLAADDAAQAAAMAAIRFSERVAQKVDELRVREEAQRRVDAERRAQTALPPFDAGTLEELQARPPGPPDRVEQLIPPDASTLEIGIRKAGKTTFKLNLAHALLTGEDFLGRFGVRKLAGNLTMLNFEVSGPRITSWAEERGIPGSRLFIVNLRGRRNPFTNPDDLEDLARLLREHDTEAIAVDPFGRAYTGKSQNDAGEVGAWLADLDRWARGDVGATDVFLSAHAGWDGERTRGSSALEDWADSIITLVKDTEGVRYMHAIGRDVDIEEDRLDYDITPADSPLPAPAPAKPPPRPSTSKSSYPSSSPSSKTTQASTAPASRNSSAETASSSREATSAKRSPRPSTADSSSCSQAKATPSTTTRQEASPNYPRASPWGSHEPPQPLPIRGEGHTGSSNREPPQDRQPAERCRFVDVRGCCARARSADYLSVSTAVVAGQRWVC